jgi:hypothetical protein
MAKKLLHSIPWFQSSRRSRGAYIMTDSPCGVRRVSTRVRIVCALPTVTLGKIYCWV